MAHIQRRCSACRRSVQEGRRACPGCGGRSGAWIGRYRGPDGQERSRSFERKVDAERWLTSQEASKLGGSWVDPALGRMTFSDWAARWESTIVDLRPTTRALNLGIVRNYLMPRFGRWPLSGIGTADVRTMVAEELAAGTLSPTAVRRHAIVLGTILGAAVDDGRLVRNPVRSVKLPPEAARPMRFLEPNELATLTAAHPAHYRPLVLTAGYVGLRWGELVGLALERVDLLRRTIRVERQLVEVGGIIQFGPPKTRAGIRTVTMPAALGEVLADHFASSAVQSSGLAFPGPKGAPLRRSNFRRVWGKACARAGLQGFVFHELRHTAAALAIAQGAHPVAIKERLGHSSITVTMDRYGGLFPGLEEAIAESLDAVFREAAAGPLRDQGGTVAHMRRSEG
jgi:integrase